MKRLFVLIIATISIISCTKERPTTNITDTPYYLGTYDAANGDTSYVEKNNNYISIGWANHLGNRRIYFDSTNVNPDSTFTINQVVNEYLWVYSRAVGTGRFLNNTLQYEININNYRISFFGVKR